MIQNYFAFKYAHFFYGPEKTFEEFEEQIKKEGVKTHRAGMDERGINYQYVFFLLDIQNIEQTEKLWQGTVLIEVPSSQIEQFGKGTYQSVGDVSYLCDLGKDDIFDVSLCKFINLDVFLSKRLNP